MITVLSPHLDDAALSAWTLLTSGRLVRVVNCFAGIPPPGTSSQWDLATGCPDSAVAVRRRRGEDTAVLAQAGLVPVNLDLVEVEYRDAGSDPLRELVAAVQPLLQGSTELWFPAAIGGQQDHVLVRRAAVRLAAPDMELVAYADQPYAALRGLPVSRSYRWLPAHCLTMRTNCRRPKATWAAEIARAGLNRAPAVPTFNRLSPAQSRAKWAAVSQYRTQIAALGYARPWSRRLLLSYEAWWRLGLAPAAIR
jgi:hypothetical protein